MLKNQRIPIVKDGWQPQQDYSRDKWFIPGKKGPEIFGRERPEYEFTPLQGIIFGVLLSLPFWLVLILVWTWLK